MRMRMQNRIIKTEWYVVEGIGCACAEMATADKRVRKRDKANAWARQRETAAID